MTNTKPADNKTGRPVHDESIHLYVTAILAMHEGGDLAWLPGQEEEWLKNRGLTTHSTSMPATCAQVVFRPVVGLQPWKEAQ